MDGALIIDKRAGMTSHDVVARIRKTVGEKRVGHTGTLDPFATGVLVALVGRATRLAQFLSGAEKEYVALVRFGYATDTGDVTGNRLETDGAAKAENLTNEEIEIAIASLRGETEQTPPMYSAKKIGGRKLYELARRGEQIERKATRIKITEFEPIQIGGSWLKPNDDGTADLKVRVVCSAGTYIRALAEDLGKRLQVGAHLAELRRTRAGHFRIDEAVNLDRLAELSSVSEIGSVLIAPDTALAHLPLVQLDTEDVRRVLNGINISLPEGASLHSGPVRLRDPEGNLLAVGMYDEQRNSIHPKVVIANVSEARP